MGRRPSLRGLPAGLFSSAQSQKVLAAGPGPPEPGRDGLPLATAALPASRRQALAGLPPLQALASQPFPIRGARAVRGLSLFPQHPLLPSHVQVLGAAKQVQAAE